jgi:TatA/E family protein of Tat protein translocase
MIGSGGVRVFGLGVPELIFILLLALLIFGPKRLPEIGRTLGRGMSEFRKASNELKRTINVELALDEQPAPPVQPYRLNPTLEGLRAARSSGAVAEPLDDRPEPELEPEPLRESQASPAPSAPSAPAGDSSTERT